MQIDSIATADAARYLLDTPFTDGMHLSFEKDTYHFYGKNAPERVSCVANHDMDGFKKIGFCFENLKDITVDGGGSLFLFHDIMLPFSCTNCENITLRNFSIDVEEICGVHSTVLEDGSLRLWEAGRLETVGGILYGRIGGELYPVRYFIEVDTERDTVAYDTNDLGFPEVTAEFTPEGNLRILTPFPKAPKPGNTLFIRFGKTFMPGFFFEKCKNIRLENITVHYSYGKAVLAQLCENFTAENFRLTPSAGRYSSNTSDGLHFVECSGSLRAKNCRFEKQMDDCINCHGIYVHVDESAGNIHLVRLMQRQQLGVPVFSPGDRVRVVDSRTMLTKGYVIVKSVENISRAQHRLVTEEAGTISPGDSLENAEHAPDLHIEGCYFGKNRARGILTTTRGKTVIQKNRFETTGTAVMIAGDANHWYESGAVRDVKICENEFVNCNTNRWGRGAIDIVPQIAETKDGYYHKNIRIENNRFRVFDMPLVYAESVDGLRISENKVEKTTDYPPKGLYTNELELTHCRMEEE
ncbi:MAG: hypothetical protein E7390_00420 [Ruminococcaceae bacterium]|nr:hypothetical protein [Oscillospiraceae bacterium]